MSQPRFRGASPASKHLSGTHVLFTKSFKSISLVSNNLQFYCQLSHYKLTWSGRILVGGLSLSLSLPFSLTHVDEMRHSGSHSAEERSLGSNNDNDVSHMVCIDYSSSSVFTPFWRDSEFCSHHGSSVRMFYILCSVHAPSIRPEHSGWGGKKPSPPILDRQVSLVFF